MIDLKRLLIQRTEGNPFFLEESVRSLVETGTLTGERGAYRLKRKFADIRVPATVQAILAARIDRLPAQEKRLLQTMAVVGKDVPYPLLRAIAAAEGARDALTEDALKTGLGHLQAAEFIYEVNLFPTLEYTFKHALTYEVAYNSLLQERRKALHAHIVRAFETLYPDRLAEHVERAVLSCGSRRNVGARAPLFAPGRSQGRRPFGQPRGGDIFRAGAVRAEASSRKPEHARAGNRSAIGYTASARSRSASSIRS